MPLTLRLRHALGDTRHTLEPAVIDAPHYVGRSKDSSVQVPSMEVSSTHCALFVHDGRWCVQDAGSRGGTFVNGLRTAQPVILSPGDVISLGRSGQSATLQIELATDMPAGSGEEEALPPLEAAVPVAAAGGENIFAPAEVPFRALAVTPRVRKKSKGPFIFGVIASLLIVAAIAGTAWFLYQEKQRQAVKPTPPPSVAPAVTDRKTIFDAPDVAAPRPRVGTRTATTVPLAPVRPADAPTDDAPAADAPEPPPSQPERDDPAWQRVLETADNPVAAVGALVEYKTAYATSPLIAEADQRLDTALDTLWWRRIGDIFDRRAALKQQIAEAQQEQSAADVLARPEIAGRVKRLTADDAALDAELKEMKFAGAVPVDPFNDAALTSARAQRDAATYTAWKQRVLTSVSGRRGEMPWD